jgi:hypothetical protein
MLWIPVEFNVYYSYILNLFQSPEKLLVAQVFKKIEPEGSLQC